MNAAMFDRGAERGRETCESKSGGGREHETERERERGKEID